MNPFLIAILAAITIMDCVVVWVVLKASAHAWNGLARAYPAAKAAPDAIRRNFQSFRIGALNYGFAVHVLVDEDRLHLQPAWIIRAFGGKPVSVPWEHVTLLERRPFRRRLAKIAGKTLSGPAWCLDLADPTGVRGRDPAVHE